MAQLSGNPPRDGLLQVQRFQDTRPDVPRRGRLRLAHEVEPLGVVGGDVPRPRMVTFSRSLPADQGHWRNALGALRLPLVYVRPSREASNRSTAPASISNTRLLTSSIGPVTYFRRERYTVPPPRL